MKARITFIPWKDQGNSRKITQKEAMEIIGAERFKEMIEDAQETFAEDPGIAIEYMVAGGRIQINF